MIRRTFLLAPVALAFTAAAAHAAPYRIDVDVDISTQTMRVSQNGAVLYTWPVSTARSGKYTIRGTYKPQWLSKHHKSSLYNNAPMPNAIFFKGNYAIHGTNQESKLGTPASAGCVRLSIANSAILFKHVEKYGNDSMRINIHA